MTTPEEYLRRALAGASLLDRREPGWRMRIVDPFEAWSSFRDVLGQLYGAHAAGIRRLDLCPDRSWKSGFGPGPVERFWMDGLQTAWNAVLTDPRPRSRERAVGSPDSPALRAARDALIGDGWTISRASTLGGWSRVVHPDSRRQVLVRGRVWNRTTRRHHFACTTVTGRNHSSFEVDGGTYLIARSPGKEA